MGVPEPPRRPGRGLPHHARGQAGVGVTAPTPSALLVSPRVWHSLGCSGSVRLSILQVNIVGFLPKTPSWGQPLREELKPSASPDPGDPSVAFGEAPGPGLVAGSVCPEARWHLVLYRTAVRTQPRAAGVCSPTGASPPPIFQHPPCPSAQDLLLELPAHAAHGCPHGQDAVPTGWPLSWPCPVGYQEPPITLPSTAPGCSQHASFCIRIQYSWQREPHPGKGDPRY